MKDFETNLMRKPREHNGSTPLGMQTEIFDGKISLGLIERATVKYQKREHDALFRILGPDEPKVDKSKKGPLPRYAICAVVSPG